MNVLFTAQLVEWHHQLVESSRLDALRPFRGFCCAANDFCQRVLVYLRRVQRLSSQPWHGTELCTILFTAPILYMSSLRVQRGCFFTLSLKPGETEAKMAMRADATRSRYDASGTAMGAL